MHPDYEFHYLPEGPEERLWGVRLLDVGSGIIQAGEKYPANGHPEAYSYSWKKGRILEECQIVVISRGQGEFESKNGGRYALSAPCVFVLFPGEWHRYRAAPETGWTEHWIGFSGDYAESVLKGIIPKEGPVIRLQDSPKELISLIQILLEQTNAKQTGNTINAIVDTIRLIGSLHKIQIARQAERKPNQKNIAEARMFILAHFNEKLDWDEIASRLGMSTPTFRRRFQQSTGLAPFQYQTKIRLNRAKTMLAAGKRVSDVSDFLGYSSPYHFSNLFSEREGLSPKAYSTKHRIGQT